VSVPKFPPRPKDKKVKSEIMRGISQLSQIAVSITVCILIGVFLGRFLDSWLGTSPWLLLIFSLMGAGAAFKYLMDMAKR